VPDPIIWVEPILVRPIFDPKETGLRLAQRVGPISAQNKSWANFNPTYFILGELDQARPTHFGLGRHWYGLGTMALHCSCSLNNEDGWAKKKKKEKKIERLTWWWWWCCHWWWGGMVAVVAVLLLLCAETQTSSFSFFVFLFSLFSFSSVLFLFPSLFFFLFFFPILYSFFPVLLCFSFPSFLFFSFSP